MRVRLARIAGGFGICLNDALAFLNRVDCGRSSRDMAIALALLDVEHGVVAKHDRLPLDSVSVCVFGFARADLPEDNPRAVLALADVATAFRGLLVGQPVRRAVAIAGQQKHVDSAICRVRLRDSWVLA